MKAEIIERLPFAEYVKLPGAHSSGLRHMLTSPLFYSHRQMRPLEDSDALRMGRAGHTSILEPQRFLAEYWQFETSRPDGTKRIRRGKEWDDECAKNAGKTALTPDQFAEAVHLRDAVRDHPVAGPLVKGIGQNELSLRWTDERTGVDMKARIDRLIHGRALIDIKTTDDPCPENFARVAWRLGYFMQMAVYSAGVEACGLGTPAVKIVAVQKCAPYDVVVYDLEQDELDFGARQYATALDRLVECRKTNKWPGFAETGSIPLRAPAWAIAQPEEEPIDFGAETIQ